MPRRRRHREAQIGSDWWLTLWAGFPPVHGYDQLYDPVANVEFGRAWAAEGWQLDEPRTSFAYWWVDRGLPHLVAQAARDCFDHGGADDDLLLRRLSGFDQALTDRGASIDERPLPERLDELRRALPPDAIDPDEGRTHG